MDEQRWLTFDLFEDRVGEQFMVGADGEEAVPLQLTDATESTLPGGTGPEGQSRLQFSLIFHGPAEPVLPQSIYRLDHDALGHLDVFLVPVGKTDAATRYQAVFA